MSIEEHQVKILQAIAVLETQNTEILRRLNEENLRMGKMDERLDRLDSAYWRIVAIATGVATTAASVLGVLLH